MLGIYFSGTGNTEYCVSYFTARYDQDSKCVPIESEAAVKEIAKNEMLVLGYPVYFSNAPKIVHEFIMDNKASFGGKKVYIIATMGLFSGDGTGCTARLLHQCEALVMGGLHVKMPDCIGDEKVLKKTAEENRTLIREAEKKLDVAVKKLNVIVVLAAVRQRR